MAHPARQTTLVRFTLPSRAVPVQAIVRAGVGYWRLGAGDSGSWTLTRFAMLAPRLRIKAHLYSAKGPGKASLSLSLAVEYVGVCRCRRR